MTDFVKHKLWIIIFGLLAAYMALIAVLHTWRTKEDERLRAEVNLYVDPFFGDDRNPCSIGYPCRTLHRAMVLTPPVLKGRMTVHLAPGLLSEFYITDAGTIAVTDAGE